MGNKQEKMFCDQCEQRAGNGCSISGVCGKDPETASMQDLLVYQTIGLAQYAKRLSLKNIREKEFGHFIIEALFTTVTNVNFDHKEVEKLVRQAEDLKKKARSLLERAGGKEKLSGPAVWELPDSYADLVAKAAEISIPKSKEKIGEDLTGLRSLLIYGLKGTAAYAEHARILGQEDDKVYDFFYEALDFLASETPSMDELFVYNMRCGEINLRVMELLDKANTGAYGDPVPTKVRITPVKGKAILVSGHDLKDLGELLKQTAGKGINVYTHGEMLPAHGYPGLKKYTHLVGNYGGAWQDQQKEFKAFPGAILMTTNCIQKPIGYEHRIFTSGLVRWPGVKHVTNKDFSPLIEAAMKEKGFETDGEDKSILTGFGHAAVMAAATTVIDHVKKGKIKHFFLVGGCDGAKSGRNYYTEFAEKAPKNTVILTLACGKFRFNKMNFGEIDGVPRLMDMGQCNDAYSAIQTALALSSAFGVPVNELPLSMVLSWYEQKAVCILLTLLYLGIKNIRLGPSLPAFLTPAVLNVLVEKFNIMPIKTAKEDLEDILKLVNV